MNISIPRAAALAGALLVAPGLAFAAATPKPLPIPTPKLPAKALHNWLAVEVNKRGQVVRIKNGILTHDAVFDTLTIGNSMQMWIRRPNGTAKAGLYRVSYDYNPATHLVDRHVSLISSGGSWADDTGAATKMIETARREIKDAQAKLQAQERQAQAEREKNLPDVNAIVKKAVVKPTSSPRP